MAESPARVRRWPHLLFRVTVTAVTLLGFAEAVFAGSFMNGHYGMLVAHQVFAMALTSLTIVLVVVAVLVRWKGAGPLWLSVAAVVLLAAIVAQVMLGLAHQLGGHVPLGVLIIGGMFVLSNWAWRTPLPAVAPRRAEPVHEPVGAAP